MSRFARNLALALPLVSSACAYKEPVIEREDIVVDAEEIGIENAHAPFPGVMTCGQPTREEYVALSKAGYRTFINMRMPSEEGTGWERKLSGALGVRYYSIPVDGAAGLTEEHARELAKAMDDSRGALVAYCSTGNRAGSILALKAYYVDGESAQKALEIGKSAGVTKMEPALRKVLELPAEE